MNIRALFPRDLDAVRKIHKKFYDKEFDFDEFSSRFLGSFVVIDDAEKVILAGGVRTLAEIVMVTDKEQSPRIRRNALIMAYDASKYIAKNTNHNSVHAFIQDKHWYDQLERYGFSPTKGQSIYSPI